MPCPYRVVTNQLADARTVDGGRWRQHLQADHAPEIAGVWPSSLYPQLFLSLGFAHRIAPQV
jgi:hypothetical protein